MPLDSKERLVAALQQARWIIAEAARSLGVSRQAIYDAMRRHGVRRRQQSPEVYREVRRRTGSLGGRPKRAAA